MPHRYAAPYVILLTVSLFGCSVFNTFQSDDVVQVNESTLVQQTERVRIRVHNQSSSNMDDILIRFVSPEDESHITLTSQDEEYGSLASAEISDYRTVSSTFGYAPIEMLINKAEQRQIPIDFVGESTIPNGNYTYALMYGPDIYSKGSDRLRSHLIYEQTALDKAIKKVLDEEIVDAIAKKHYKDEFMVHFFSCVHQQTHRSPNESASPMIVYAKVVCTVPSSEPKPGKRLEKLSPLPIRLEIQKDEGLYAVTGYQFPEAAPQNEVDRYEADMKDIFAASAITQINDTTIYPETYNRLKLKGGPVR